MGRSTDHPTWLNSSGNLRYKRRSSTYASRSLNTRIAGMQQKLPAHKPLHQIWNSSAPSQLKTERHHKVRPALPRQQHTKRAHIRTNQRTKSYGVSAYFRRVRIWHKNMNRKTAFTGFACAILLFGIGFSINHFNDSKSKPAQVQGVSRIVNPEPEPIKGVSNDQQANQSIVDPNSTQPRL